MGERLPNARGPATRNRKAPCAASMVRVRVRVGLGRERCPDLGKCVKKEKILQEFCCRTILQIGIPQCAAFPDSGSYLSLFRFGMGGSNVSQPRVTLLFRASTSSRSLLTIDMSTHITEGSHRHTTLHLGRIL